LVARDKGELPAVGLDAARLATAGHNGTTPTGRIAVPDHV
jgi:hypothetical protein